MSTPIEAYRHGYEKGRSDSAGGRLAEITMGMLRDDPGGYFQKGYSDGAAGMPFNPPSIPAPKRLRTKGLIPRFSENPFGWFLGVVIVIELWVLWQLIKAPFQLVSSLMRSEKPSPSVIVKNVVVAGLAIALVWWAPRVNEVRGPGTNPMPIPVGQAPPAPDPANHFDSSAVWNPPEIVWRRIQNDCRPAQGPVVLTTCVTGIMQETSASADAIRFTRLLHGEGYMTDFRQAGNLGVVTAFHPFRANDNDAIYVVNGSPALIDPDQLSSKVDIRTDSAYPSIAGKYPQVMLWEHAAFKEARQSARVQQLVFRMALLNGCHACEVAGTATVALDFDASGRLLGTRLLGLSSPEPGSPPLQPTTTPPRPEQPAGLPLIADLPGLVPMISGNGRVMATTMEPFDAKHESHIWFVETGQKIRSLVGVCEGLSPDGHLVALRVSDQSFNQFLEVRETDSSRLIQSWKESFDGFGVDGKSIRTWTWVNQQVTTRIRDLDTGAVVATVPGSHGVQRSSMLLTQSGELPTKTFVWDLKSNQLVRSVAEQPAGLSPDGTLVATKSKTVLTIWDVQTGRRVATVECWGNAYFSRDWRFVVTEVYDNASGGKQQVSKVWDMRSGRFLHVIPGQVSAEGMLAQTVATTVTGGSDLGTTKLLELLSGTEIAEVKGAFRGFSVDGALVMTAPDAKSTAIWRSNTGERVADLPGYAVSISSVPGIVLTGGQSLNHLWRLR